ncbi:MAG TPA: amino acid aminotransferase [Candidatus Saccharimonadia bacterium]|nr:amino acid aminotransferase [Candidatus Saccharimonadia bacterium]
MTTAFADLRPAPPDSILGLAEAFRADPRPEKISLASGVYVDEQGITPVLATVTEAEQRILDAQTTKLYKPIIGDPAYLGAVRELLFGADHPLLAAGRVQTLHAPGGTGALRVAADLLHRLRPETTVWLSTPTWPNHPQVFAAAGLRTRAYAYLHPATGSLDLAALIGSLADASPGDVVVLHGCCHNPSGVDPTAEQWAQLAAVVAQRRLLPLVDFAYQGFGDGLRDDAAGMLTVAAASPEFLVASSFSKNFALYAERVGALSIVGADAHESEVLMSHAKAVVRTLYSNPPAHGGEVVATVLLDAGLRARWEGEVAGMRDRINGNRRRFVEGLRTAGVSFDPEPLLRQRGMFSLLDMTADQVGRLREERAIYLVGAGRVNVAGITDTNLEPVCAAIAAEMRRT